MERVREIVLKMIRLSDDGRKGPISENEMLLRDRIKEVLGLYSRSNKGLDVFNGK